MNDERITLQELAAKCIKIQEEMISVHDALTAMCRIAVSSGEGKKADTCVEAGAFLVKAGDSLMKAQGVICRM